MMAVVTFCNLQLEESLCVYRVLLLAGSFIMMQIGSFDAFYHLLGEITMVQALTPSFYDGYLG